uniref:Sodium-coupled monocarboxylate transporter 1 n=2 Tax=Photinus pyralis TaxID=7054 RepID=A0A1Y1LHV3_PHOPY
MEDVRFLAIDYLLFIFMFGLSCIVGIYFGCCGNQSTTAEYFLGGKKMKVFPISMSLVASTLSGIGLISLPAEVYMHGMQISVMIFGVITMGVLNNYLYMPVFHRLKLSTVNDYLEIRFDRVIKLIASFLYLITCILFLPLVIYAPSLAFTQVTGIQLHLIAPIMSVICIFYTTIGGLKAIVWTDTLQFSITLCTLAIVLVIGICSVGGPKTIWEASESGDRLEFFNVDPNPTLRCTFWSVFVGSIFTWLGFVAINPSGVQRFSSIPKLEDAKKASIIFSVFASLAKVISCFSGLILYTKYYGCDPLSAGYITKIDQIVPYYVTDIAKQTPGVSGLFIAGLFSTAMSTLSTHLNTVAGVLYLDFIKPTLRRGISEQASSNIIKVLTIVIGLVNVGMIFVADKLGSLFELFHSAQAITGGPVLGLFTLGMLFPCANRRVGSS